MTVRRITVGALLLVGMSLAPGGARADDAAEAGAAWMASLPEPDTEGAFVFEGALYLPERRARADVADEDKVSERYAGSVRFAARPVVRDGQQLWQLTSSSDGPIWHTTAVLLLDRHLRLVRGTMLQWDLDTDLEAHLAWRGDGYVVCLASESPRKVVRIPAEHPAVPGFMGVLALLGRLLPQDSAEVEIPILELEGNRFRGGEPPQPSPTRLRPVGRGPFGPGREAVRVDAGDGQMLGYDPTTRAFVGIGRGGAAAPMLRPASAIEPAWPPSRNDDEMGRFFAREFLGDVAAGRYVSAARTHLDVDGLLDRVYGPALADLDVLDREALRELYLTRFVPWCDELAPYRAGLTTAKLEGSAMEEHKTEDGLRAVTAAVPRAGFALELVLRNRHGRAQVLDLRGGGPFVSERIRADYVGRPPTAPASPLEHGRRFFANVDPDRALLETWVARLGSDNEKLADAARNALEHAWQPRASEHLRARFLDTAGPFGQRRTIGEILCRRGASLRVEALLTHQDADERALAISSLFDAWDGETDPFVAHYGGEEEVGLAATLLAWLSDEQAPARDLAVRLATAALDAEQIDRDVALEHLRLVALPTGGAADESQHAAITVAARALVDLGDCPTLPALARLARETTAQALRAALAWTLYRGTVSEGAPCAGAVEEEEVQALVVRALEDGDAGRAVLLRVLTARPDWLPDARPALQALLDDPEARSAEKSVALRLLLLHPGVTEHPGQLLMRSFHHPDGMVRREALDLSIPLSLQGKPGGRLQGCWIGLLADGGTGPGYADVARAWQALTSVAGRLAGLPPEVRANLERGSRGTQSRLLRMMLEEGESHGVTRESWAEAWFAWWAEELGLSEVEVKQACAARRAFREAADVGDVSRAEEAIIVDLPEVEDLFRYERGWLLARARR